MIYYILLFTAALLFGSQFIVTKGYELHNGKDIDASFMFTGIAGFFACLVFLIINKFSLNISLFSCIMAVLLALVSILCNGVGIKALAKGDISIYTLFLMSGGMILPFAVGVLFLQEVVSIYMLIGVVLMLLTLALPSIFNNKSKKIDVFFIILCILLFILNGLSSVITKLHQVNVNAVGTTDFTVIYFGITFILAMVCFFVYRFFNKEKAKESKVKFDFKSICFGFGYALFNGTASFLQLISAKHVYASAQFPIITGGVIIFSAILAMIIYKEKPSKTQCAQLGLAVLSTVLFLF